MKECSLGLLKPDCIQRGLTDTILEMVRRTGLKIVAIKTLTLTKENIEIFYANCRNEDFFDGLSEFMQSGQVIAYIVQGENARAVLTELVGFGEPSWSKVGTVRSMGKDIRHNLAHSSRNKDDFLREVSVIFTKEELRGIGVV